MIVGNCTSSDLDEAFKELQTRRAADVELIAVLEKHAAANPPNAAAVLCAQVVRQQQAFNMAPQPLTPLYALVPQLTDAVAEACANYLRVMINAVESCKPPVYIVATQEQIDKIMSDGEVCNACAKELEKEATK